MFTLKSDFSSLPDEIVFSVVCYPYVFKIIVTNIWKQFSEIVSRYEHVKLNEKKKIETYILYSLWPKKIKLFRKKEAQSFLIPKFWHLIILGLLLTAQTLNTWTASDQDNQIINSWCLLSLFIGKILKNGLGPSSFLETDPLR